MEALLFVLVLLGIIVLIMFLQFINSRRDDKLYLLKLKNRSGNNLRSSYDHNRLITASAYYRRHISTDHIDDITWTDLSMDEIMAAVDTTESEAGCQVLYHMLRTPLTDKESILSARSIIDHYRQHEDIADRIRLLLHHIGVSGSGSAYDMMDAMNGMETVSFVPYYIRIAALVLSFALIWPLKGIGVVLFILILISNLYVYYRDRSRILPYMRVYSYVLKLMESGRSICDVMKSDGIGGCPGRTADELGEVLDKLKGIRRMTMFSLSSEMGYNPIAVILGMLGVFVYADIIRFYRIKSGLSLHREDIDRLIYLIGITDAYIAVAGYVEAAGNRMCAAEVTDGDAVEVTDVYHPLLDDPVPNSVRITGSILITGANASGKSTFLKSMALAAIYAQTFGYVCAGAYSAPICMISSAMSVTDDVTSGDSYYMAEIKAVKRMADRYSRIRSEGRQDVLPLCFVDELLNGTNTEERIAACTQILLDMDRQGMCVLAATHDIELTVLLSETYANHHFEEDLSEGDVKFSYKLKEGAAKSRNAIRLLRELGFDPGMADRAEEMVRIHKKERVWMTV